MPLQAPHRFCRQYLQGILELLHEHRMAIPQVDLRQVGSRKPGFREFAVSLAHAPAERTVRACCKWAARAEVLNQWANKRPEE
jgi:hypothetical protein